MVFPHSAMPTHTSKKKNKSLGEKYIIYYITILLHSSSDMKEAASEMQLS